jgi:hypothetical protein
MEHHRTESIEHVQQISVRKKLETIDLYTQLANFESDEWHVAYVRNLKGENKLI